MSYMDFTQSPSYQRMMQKLQTIRPEQRAVLNTLAADEEFADAATRKNLAAIVQRNNINYRNKTYDSDTAYRNKAYDSDTAYRNKAYDSDELYRNKAYGLNDTYRNESYALNKDFADRSLDVSAGVANRSLGLRREQLENEQDQNQMATGLGIGQVLAEANYGSQRDALDLETFKEKKKLADRLKQIYGGG